MSTTSTTEAGPAEVPGGFKHVVTQQRAVLVPFLAMLLAVGVVAGLLVLMGPLGHSSSKPDAPTTTQPFTPGVSTLGG